MNDVQSRLRRRGGAGRFDTDGEPLGEMPWEVGLGIAVGQQIEVDVTLGESPGWYEAGTV